MINLREAVFNALVNAKSNGYDTFLDGSTQDIAEDLLEKDADVALAARREDEDLGAMLMDIAPFVEEWKRNLA